MGLDVHIPNPFTRSTLYFLVLLVGICIFFAGTTAWFVTADMDYHFGFSGEIRDEAPRYETTVHYGNLPPEHQRMFHAAVEDGKTFGKEESSGVPDADVIYYEGQYYVFNVHGYYDWLNPATSGPVLVAVLGLGLMVEAARRDHRYHP